MTTPTILSELARVNRLGRAPGPVSYRLMAVDLRGEHLFGQTAGWTLERDIASYRSEGCRPLYAVFVRPRTPAAAMGLPSPVSLQPSNKDDAR